MGSVLELEYIPVAHLDVAGPIMEELVEALRAYLPGGGGRPGGTAGTAEAGATGQLEVLRPSYEKYSGLPSSAYSHAHAAIMYADLAVMLISSQQA